MGIAGYWQWMIDNYSHGFVSIPKDGIVETEHILIDLNGIFHTTARKASGWKALITVMFSKLNKILNRFKATKTVFLALDGPASSAKMKTQKQRRETKMRKRSEKSSKTLNTCLLTPGTSMMDQCKDALLYYCCQRLQNEHKDSQLQFIISAADTAGEGELKIISWIHENQSRYPCTDRYLIVSCDADLVLLCLGTLHRNIFLLHDVSDVVLLSTNEIVGEFQKQSNCSSPSLIRDFIFISVLQGNDYLPKLKKSTMNLWFEYLEYRKTVEFRDTCILNENYTINWRFLMKILSSVSPLTDIEKADSLDKFKPASKYEKSLRKTEDYLQGLLWCVYMCGTGCCPDYSYSYPHYTAPSALQLCYYYMKHCVEKTEVCSVSVVPNSRPLSPILFALTVLPLSAKECLPSQLQFLMEETSAIYNILATGDTDKKENIEAIQDELNLIPIEILSKPQRKQIKQCGPAIILMKQENHTFPRHSFLLRHPSPPLSHFSAIQRTLKIRGMHFDNLKRRNLPQLV